MIPRVVLDTNVLISALIFGGKPRQVLDLSLTGKIRLLVSQPLELELDRVLRDKFELSQKQLDANIHTFWNHAEWIAPQHRLHLCPDEPDNRVLECAIEGRASFIVTGDRHLLDLPPVEGISILTPAAFLARLSVA